jgi:hypothetical protein
MPDTPTEGSAPRGEAEEAARIGAELWPVEWELAVAKGRFVDVGGQDPTEFVEVVSAALAAAERRGAEAERGEAERLRRVLKDAHVSLDLVFTQFSLGSELFDALRDVEKPIADALAQGGEKR